MSIQISRFRMQANRVIAGLLAAVLLTGISTPVVAFADDAGSSSTSSSTAKNADDKQSKPDSRNKDSGKSDTDKTQSAPASSAASNSSPSSDTSTPSLSSQPTAPVTEPAQPKAQQAKPSAQNGPNKPNGADSGTYKYNSTTGLWENDYYTWNPSTGQTSPKKAASYSYNPSTGMWDTTQWKYDAAAGSYVPNVVTVPASQVPAASKAAAVAGGNSRNPNGGSIAVSSGDNSGTFNNFYNAAISNKLNAVAISGDAIVSANTTAGGAMTGDANNNANILNMLQSTASLLGGNAQTFVSNIYGDVQGDLMIDPASLGQSGSSASTLDNNFKLNQKNTGTIDNDIDLTSKSGDATVTRNTNGGDATTGNATAVANVVNMLNSMVTADQSFLGVVNIYGNLTGNIVMPQQFMDQLLATNAPTTSIDTSAINQFSSNVNNNQTINNQVSTAATSGNATIDRNTTAGGATTGTASNKVTVFNLTGSQFIGSDAMLVFVNVMGQWVGVMMNAPSGTSAAAYGSGATTSATATSRENNTTSATVTNNQSINNNIKANAQSGDAAVTNNTKAGNAKSGNASTAVNLLNMTNDTFNLSRWFGILFINVFGNWYGDFGVSKPVVASTGGVNQSTANQSSSNTNGNATNNSVQVFRFVPKADGSSQPATTTSSSLSPDNFQLVSAKLATTSKQTVAKTTPAVTNNQQDGIQGIQIIGALTFIGGLGLFLTEHRVRSRSISKM